MECNQTELSVMSSAWVRSPCSLVHLMLQRVYLLLSWSEVGLPLLLIVTQGGHGVPHHTVLLALSSSLSSFVPLSSRELHLSVLLLRAEISHTWGLVRRQRMQDASYL